MKKLLSIMTAVLLMAISAIGQSPAPGLFNYQGVARNSVGNVLVNKTISLRLTIHDGTPGGPSVYQETRTVTTNPFGLFNVQVGGPGASSSSGTIPGVNWGVNAKYIQVEIDPNGGSTFINIGTAQIASVPYALYSSLSNDLVLPFDKTQADAGTLFKVTNSGTGAGSRALEGLTNSTAGNVYAVTGTVTSSSPGGFSTGVRGINNGTGGLGIGVWGSQAGSGWGVYGTAPSGVGGYFVSTSGTGVWGASTSGNAVYGNSTSGVGGRFTSTSGQALYTTGGVRLSGINEAANRILTTVPGDGTATWQDPAVVGIVTGSGTLNYVPKWTPNGTNLGNSNIFVDATNFSTSINTTTMPTTNALNVSGGWAEIQQGSTSNYPFLYLNSIAASGNGGIIFGASSGGDNGRFLYRTSGDYLSISHRNGGASTNGLADLVVKNGDVGISTTTPVGKLHAVSSTSALAPSFYFDNNSNSGFSWSTLALRSTGTAQKLQSIQFDGTSTSNARMFFNESGLFTNHLILTTNNSGNTPDISINKANSNVGIGRVNAGAKLHVDGSMDLSASLGSFSFSHQALLAQTSATATASISRSIIGYVANSSAENHGVFGYANGSGSAYNVGFFSLASGTTSGGNFGYYANVANSSTANIGIQTNVPGGANDRAAIFNGKVQIADGTEGAGRIFTDNGAGTGTGMWSTAAAAGLVSGSGTLNYIPKWTPNGTTLGNSLALDDNNSINIGNYYGNPNSLNVYTTPGHTNPSFLIGEGNVAGMYLDDATGNLHVTINDIDVEAGTKLMTFDDGSLAVGIGTATPTAKLELRGYNSTNNTFTSASGFNGATGIAVMDATAESGFKSSIYSFADGATGDNLSVWGETGTTSNTSNIGLYGRVSLAPTGTGLSAGLFAHDVVNGPNTWAAIIRGRMQYQDGTQGAGKVLTSDANGNASWQGPVGIRLSGLSSSPSIPFFTYAPINQWANVDYENGSVGNYNAGTGEYTVPVSGVYQINANVTWNQPAANGSGYSGISIFVNGAPTTGSLDNLTTTNLGSPGKVSASIQLNAGDLIQINVFHRTSGSLTLNTTDPQLTHWSMNLIK